MAPASIILLGLALEGLTTLSTGLAPSLAIFLRSVGGVGNGNENVAADTLFQKVVPRSMLGRVFGVYYGGVFLAEGLAYAAGGPLLELAPRCLRHRRLRYARHDAPRVAAAAALLLVRPILGFLRC